MIGNLVNASEANTSLVERVPIFPVKSNAELDFIILDLLFDPVGLALSLSESVGIGIEINSDGDTKLVGGLDIGVEVFIKMIFVIKISLVTEAYKSELDAGFFDLCPVNLALPARDIDADLSLISFVIFDNVGDGELRAHVRIGSGIARRLDDIESKRFGSLIATSVGNLVSEVIIPYSIEIIFADDSADRMIIEIVATKHEVG